MRHSPEWAEPQRAPLALRRRSADTMSRKLQPIEPCAASENAARHGPSSPQDAQWCRRHPTLRCHSGQKATNAMLVQTETPFANARSEEHTSELQSLMRISYAVFCLKQNKKTNTT